MEDEMKKKVFAFLAEAVNSAGQPFQLMSPELCRIISMPIRVFPGGGRSMARYLIKIWQLIGNEGNSLSCFAVEPMLEIVAW
jgi:hypothetical protein